MTTTDESTPSLDDMDAVRRKLKELARDGRIDELIEMVVDLLLQVRDDNTALQARLRASLRALYGRRSEKVSREQLELAFDKLGDDVPESALDAVGDKPSDEPIEQPPNNPRPARSRKGRNPLPSHLPRETKELLVPESERACEACGTNKTRIGFVRSEILEFVPAHFKVVEECREKVACPKCEAGVVVAETEKVRDRGRPGPGLLAQLFVGKHADALPIYRQAQIYARQGVLLDRSTLSDWVGRAAWWLTPLRDHLLADLKRSGKLFADETTAPVLDPGRGRTKTGQLWAYARDDRPWGGSDPPAVAYCYAPDRKAERPIEHLAGFKGTLQVDGYGGYGALARRGEVALAFCWAHVRRRFYELAAAGASPVASDVLARIARLYALETDVRDQSPDQRRAARQEHSRPIIDELHRVLDTRLTQVSRKSRLAEAIRYALTRWEGLTRFLDDGRIELDSNTVERSIRPIALNRKNALFAGSDDGGEHWAVIASLIETAKLNGINPQAWLTDTLSKLAAGHRNDRLGELMPWNYSADVA